MMIRYLRWNVIIILLFFVSSCSFIPFFGSKERNQIVELAMQYKGVKYQWGGASPRKGFDCSGLVYYVYKKSGYNVPRTTALQKEYGSRVRFGPLKKGDLIFFNLSGKKRGFLSPFKKVEHVGIYIGSDQFIHAPSTGKTVRVDSLKNPLWDKKRLFIRRYI